MATVSNFDLFSETPTQLLSVIDITFNLPTGFREQDDLDSKIDAMKRTIWHYLKEGWAMFQAYSGGKDSSVQLALTLMARREFIDTHGKEACPPLMIMHSDTLLENPVISAHTRSEIARIRMYSEIHNLPVTVKIAYPSLSENYLVNVIGGRTIASTAETKSRKCAIMMKVNPIQRMKRKILNSLQEEYGEKVLTLIGKRYDESAFRKSDKIANGEVPHQHVERNGENILSSIAHFSLSDIYWAIGMVRSDQLETYSDFTSLVETYKAANGGECLVNALDGKAGGTGCGPDMVASCVCNQRMTKVWKRCSRMSSTAT